jgi:hypothetical protein
VEPVHIVNLDRIIVRSVLQAGLSLHPEEIAGSTAKDKSAQPGLTSCAMAGRAAICAPAQRAFWLLLRSSIPLETNMAPKNFKLLICLLILSEPALAQAKCLETVREIKANDVKTRWRETTENDGKPLTISIAEGANGLVYSAKKAGVPWLTGKVSVCRSGNATEITLKDTKATNHVPMLARLGLPSTQSVHIVNNQIKLKGGGWSGTFVGR